MSFPASPDGCKRYTGVVIASRLEGPIVGAVYVPHGQRGQVFLMPYSLFLVDMKQAAENNWSKSRVDCVETSYSFGDCLTFDGNELGFILQIVGRSPTSWEPTCFGNVLALKTTAVVSDNGRIWSPEFGILGFVGHGLLPLHDVPMKAFVQCDYSIMDPFAAHFALYKFVDVDIGNMVLVHDTPWQRAKQMFQPPPLLHDDESNSDEVAYDQVQGLREATKPGGELIRPLWNLEGVLFPEFIYARAHPNRLYRRTRLDGPLQPGTLVRFNAIYSDIHNSWITFNVDRNRSVNQPMYVRNLNILPSSNIMVMFPVTYINSKLTMSADLKTAYEVPGMYENPHLGYVSDRRGVIATLTELPKTNTFKATIMFGGFVPNVIANFETLNLLEEFKKEFDLHYRAKLNSRGYIVANEIICPRFLTAKFNVHFSHNLSNGTCVDFRADINVQFIDRATYEVCYLQPASSGNTEKYPLDTMRVDGDMGIICMVYPMKICPSLDAWVSPLLGVVEDVCQILDEPGSQGNAGNVVVVRRDHQFSQCSSLFYIYSLAPRHYNNAEFMESFVRATSRIVATLAAKADQED
uniref:Major capsid protein n=1 Tax=Steinernema glaseri TaxID=37863 RepID=A0A1I7ZNJ0_9BILA